MCGSIARCCNFEYEDGPNDSKRFTGRAYFMYATVELAHTAMDELHRCFFNDRLIRAVPSRQRVDCHKSRGLIGQTRHGEEVWNCWRFK